MAEPEGWLDEPITFHQHVLEQAVLAGAPWSLAMEAVASTALDHPEAPWETVRTRREWETLDGDA